MAIEAAKELGDPEFYELLIGLLRDEPRSCDDLLQEAIESCRPK